MEKYVDIKSPFTGGKVKEISTIETHEFRKETYDVHVRYYVCEDTGEKFTTTEQDEFLFNDLYSQYRVKHGIPFQEDIKNIRLRYGLNYQQITKILGFGANQYAQYEKGQIPSESNGKMISAIQNRNIMLNILKESKCEFAVQEYNKIVSIIEKSKEANEVDELQNIIYRNTKRSIYNGFGAMNINKLTEMIKFFISKEGCLFPTKLNKELFYADFRHYQLHGISISGLNYKAIQYGPVPVHYDTIYDNIEGINKNIVMSHNNESSCLTCDNFKIEALSESEINTLNEVIKVIQPMTTEEIVNHSHKEDAWINYHNENKIIPYTEAFSLKLFL